MANSYCCLADIYEDEHGCHGFPAEDDVIDYPCSETFRGISRPQPVPVPVPIEKTPFAVYWDGKRFRAKFTQ